MKRRSFFSSLLAVPFLGRVFAAKPREVCELCGEAGHLSNKASVGPTDGELFWAERPGYVRWCKNLPVDRSYFKPERRPPGGYFKGEPVYWDDVEMTATKSANNGEYVWVEVRPKTRQQF